MYKNYGDSIKIKAVTEGNMKTGKSNLKYDRMLDLYMRLSDGEIINKENAAKEYQVDGRSIQRDIDALRDFFSNQTVRRSEIAEIVYDRNKKGYRLEFAKKIKLTNAELFTVVKLLLESRSLDSSEMKPLINKLLEACVPPTEKRRMTELVNNELFHYIGPRHNQVLVNKIWELSEAMYAHKKLDMRYRRLDGVEKRKKVKPVGLMASEYYFYLAGFEKDTDKDHAGYPTIYRIDRIEEYQILDETFSIPYKDRIEEGEFRKKMPFMYSGPLTKVEFIYRGLDLNAVLDRLPSAEYKKREDGTYLIKTEVYGTYGIGMWLGSQGDKVDKISCI